jgi:hypothetical protein
MTFDCSRGAGFNRLLAAVVCGLVVLLSGCHGSTIELPGTPVLTMGGLRKDPDPYFSNYLITIDAITLTRNDGAVVEPLSTPEIVDLAQVTDMAELVEAPAVPEGTYVSAQVTLDYTSASIWLNQYGGSVLATPVDPSGDVMTTATVTITFDPAHPLVITNNVSNRVSLDIDLTAFNSVDAKTATVTVQPFIVMTPAVADQTVMRARGNLVLTQPPGDYIMNARPFYDLVSELGAVTVNVSDKTYYNINGSVLTGSAGLAALGALPVNSSVAAYGTLGDLSTITPTFNATQVYAGTSLESELGEYASGTVTSRVGDVVTVRGVTYLTPLGDTFIYPSAQISLAGAAGVAQDGVVNSALSIDDVSIGSQITVYGTGSISTANALSVDATSGLVRIAPSQLYGGLRSTAAGTTVLSLDSLNGWPMAAFNFPSTAAAGPLVDPTNYSINTGSLSVSGVATGELVRMTGAPSAFGAPAPNFTATTATPGTATEQQLVVEWINGGAAAPFSSYSRGLVVDLANADINPGVAYIRTGPSVVLLNSLSASPLITTTGAQGPLVLAVGNDVLTNGVSVYNTLDPFVAQVKNSFPSGTANRLFRLVAYGQYSSTSNTFVATRIYVAIQEAAAT